MKTKILLSFLLICLVQEIRSQDHSGVEITGGYAQNGFGVSIGYNYYTNRQDYLQAAILYTNSKETYMDIDIPYNLFTFNGAYFFKILSNYSRSLNLSLGGGGVAGYEIVNKGENELTTGALILDKSNFIYGAFAGIELDIYMADELSILLKANEYYHFNSDLGELTPYIGIGLKYLIY